MIETLHSPRGRRREILALLTVAGALAFGAIGCEDDGAQTSASGQQGTATPPPPASTYRLSQDGKALVDSDGTRIAIDPERVTGYVDAAVPNGQYLDMSGWAAPADLSRPAETIVAVAGNKSVVSVKPSGDRPDLVEGYDRPGLAKAGFAMSIPKSSLQCSAPSQGLKTYGVAGDVAGPLEWLADVPSIVADAC